jgi:hypothetical protein
MRKYDNCDCGVQVVMRDNERAERVNGGKHR